MEAYCVKCRTQREVKDAKEIKMSNGRPAMQGTCTVCGTKLTRIVKSS
jgi:DNA polymerase II large subunit